MSFASVRLGLSRFRLATRLCFVLIALLLLNPVIVSIADVLPPGTKLRDAVRSMARLTGTGFVLGLASATFTVLFVAKAHPSLGQRHMHYLRSSPWKPGRTMLLGNLTLTGPFILMPAIVLLLAWMLNGDRVGWIASGVALGYALIAVTVAFLTRQALLPAMMAISAAWVTYTLRWGFDALVPVAIGAGLICADVIIRRGLVHDFLGKSMADLKSLNSKVPRISGKGWLSVVAPQPKRPNVAARLIWFAAAAVVVVVVFLMIDVSGVVMNDMVRNAVAYFLGAVAIFRLLSLFSWAVPAFDPLARISAGKWIAWRFDAALVAPAVLMLIAFMFYSLFRSQDVVVCALSAGTAVLLGLAIYNWFPPTKLAWQTTGACRLKLKPTAAEQVSEKQLKQLMNRSN
jgi:hypothetical protein